MKKFKFNFRNWYREQLDAKTRVVLGLTFVILSTCLLLAFDLIPAQVSYREGEIAGEDIYFRGNTTTYSSAIRTATAKEEAAAHVDPVYMLDKTITKSMLDELDADLEAALAVLGSETKTVAEKRNDLRDLLPGLYTDNQLNYVIGLDPLLCQGYLQQFAGVVEATLQNGFRADELDDMRDTLTLNVNNLDLPGDMLVFLRNYINGMELQANSVYDARGTQTAIARVTNEVSNVQVTVRSGEKLISRGESITAEQVEALQALGLQTSYSGFAPYAGMILLVLFCYFIYFSFFRVFNKYLSHGRYSVLLPGSIIIVVLFISKVLSLFTISTNTEIAAQIGYLLPTACASMLVAMLMNWEVALLTTLLLSVFSGIICDGEMAYMLASLCGGSMGALVASRLDQRSQFINASLYVAATNVVAAGAWGLLFNQSYKAIVVGMLFGVANGFLSAMLAMGMLPFLESAFAITTNVRLLELTNTNHPLLKKLMLEAPGTYNHSLLVASLAEAAADAIGADALLVRAAAYFHDMGKLKRPYFFIENQSSGDNPHDKLQPAISTTIITSHPKDSAAMLREYDFPQEIIDIVEQHHGNSVMSYFYNKALQQAEDPADVDVEDFRYKCAKPQSKEAGLLMLADSVQAAVHSIRTASTPDAIEAKVRAVIRAKQDEGQLAECPLTFRDLDTITQAFMMVLAGMNHNRIAYPSQGSGDAGQAK